MRSGSGRRPTGGRGRLVRTLGAAIALIVTAATSPALATKGPVVDLVSFSGNDHVHPDSLSVRMETHKSGFLSRHRLDSFTLGQDLVNLQTYYQDLGFLT